MAQKYNVDLFRFDPLDIAYISAIKFFKLLKKTIGV